jgi:HTH-type transcriptional regulator / antitoxin HigA
MTTRAKDRVNGDRKHRGGAKSIPQAYLDLLARFRLKPIANDQELGPIALTREPDGRDKLSVAEEEYVEVLCALSEAYEDRHVTVPDVSAGEMLRFLIVQRGVTQQTVARETGIGNSTITVLLHGDRALTRRDIEAFARYFGVPAAVFLPPE